MALFVSIGVAMTSLTFVEFRGLLKAGHATQRRRSAGKANSGAVHSLNRQL